MARDVEIANPSILQPYEIILKLAAAVDNNFLNFPAYLSLTHTSPGVYVSRRNRIKEERMIKKISYVFSFTLLMICFYTTVFAAETACNVCSMKILDNSRQHFLVQETSLGKEPLHVCSVTCLHKLRKFNPNISKIDISNFNDPSKFLKADKAFFLVKSEKVKSDAGPM